MLKHYTDSNQLNTKAEAFHLFTSQSYKMLSKRFYKWLGQIMPIYCFFGVSLYPWDPINHVFLLKSSSFKQTFFNIIFLISWCTFYFAQIVRYYYIGNLNNVIFLCLLFTGMCITLVSFYISIFCGKDLMTLANWTIKTLQRWNGKLILF